MLLCTKEHVVHRHARAIARTTKVRRQTPSLSRDGYQKVQHDHTLGVLFRRRIIVLVGGIHVLRHRLLVIISIGVRRRTIFFWQGGLETSISLFRLDFVLAGLIILFS